MKTYVIDIDGTICTNTYGDYEKAIPFYDRIAYVNYLYKKGNIIKLKLILFSFKNIKNIVKKKGIAFTKENKIRITDTKQYFDIEFLYSFVFKYF